MEFWKSLLSQKSTFEFGGQGLYKSLNLNSPQCLENSIEKIRIENLKISLCLCHFISSLYRISRLGARYREESGGGTFYIGEIKNLVFFKLKIFHSFKKSMKILYVFRNFQIYMQKSQWTTDLLPIFSPIFQDFCYFIHLWNISKILGLVWGLFRRDWVAGGTFAIGGWGLYKPLLHVLLYVHTIPNSIWCYRLTETQCLMY